MRQIVLCMLFVALGACVSAPPIRPSGALFLDERFGQPPPEIAELDVFAISPAMREYLDTDVARQVRRSGRNYGLYEVLRHDLSLEYDAALTRTAAQAFDAKAGNCLSLVMLTAALAKELHVPVRYRLVRGDPVWTRSGGLTFANGHVNIELEPTRTVGSVPESRLVIDFTPVLRGSTGDFDEIPERQIVAMYMNNRAAESLVAGEVETAYWWVRTSIERMPTYSQAYNTLGVIYRQHGDLAAAERVFTYELQRSPKDATLLANLALTLRRENRSAEAALVEQRLAELETYRPFEYLDKGNEAIAAGDAKAAMRFYRKELAHIPYSAELHYAIALASARLGDDRGARRHLNEAMVLSNNLHDRDLYAGKLERLRSLQTH